MLKKTITYTDYNGATVTEDFYFNLSKAELIEMQVSESGGFDTLIKKIIESEDQAKLMMLFKTILLKSYGIKTEDGKRFIKNDNITEAFKQTEAYPILFIELLSDADAASNFIKGILPRDLASDIDSKVEEYNKELEKKG